MAFREGRDEVHPQFTERHRGRSLQSTGRLLAFWQGLLTLPAPPTEGLPRDELRERRPAWWDSQARPTLRPTECLPVLNVQTDQARVSRLPEAARRSSALLNGRTIDFLDFCVDTISVYMYTSRIVRRTSADQQPLVHFSRRWDHAKRSVHPPELLAD